MSELSDQIYDILVEECGAYDDVPKESSFEGKMNPHHVNLERGQFALWFKGEGSEYRFGGKLGFGGKIWKNSGKIYVNCYKEDENSDRLEMIEKANARLEELDIAL